jgi:hypothetical protein
MQYRKLILCLGLLNASLAAASPADYVYTPTVEYGEKEIDFKYGNAKEQGGARSQTTSLGFGYGATEYWFTEVYLKREIEGSEKVTIAEWENKFQLTETGKYFIDVGLITEIEAPLTNGHDPYEVKIGGLFQKELGNVQLNANLLFKRKIGPKDPDEHYVTEIGYQWQAKYRWKEAFEFGLQGMGEMGKWDDWDESKLQNHRMGPAVFGKIGLGQKQAIKYNAAMLFGVSDAAPDHTFRMQAEYEF